MENKEAVDLDFSRYLLAVKRRWVPATSILLSTIALSILGASLLKPSYQGETKILFKNSSYKVAGANLSSNQQEGSDTGELRSLVATQNPISTQLEVIGSEPILQKVIDRLQLKDAKKKPMKVKELQSGLNIKIAGGADVAQIIYKTPKRENAALVPNTIAQMYLENEIQANRDEAETTLQYMSKQLPQTRMAVERSELELRQFKQKNNVIDLSEEAKAAVTTISSIENAISTTRSQIEDLTAQESELREKLSLTPDQAIAVSAVSQSSNVQAILSQLQDIDRQLAVETSRFSSNNPIVTSLIDKKANLTTLLRQQLAQIGSKKESAGNLRLGDLKQNLIKDFLQLKVQRSGATKKLASLTDSLASYQRRVGVIPKLAQQQQQLERNLDVSKTTNQTLLKKFQELQLIKNRSIPNARIIASAVVPQQPEKSNKMLMVGLGVLAGGFLATSSVLLLEMRDKSLKTVKEVRDLFGYKLLGIVPSTRKKLPTRKLQPATTSLEVAVRDTPQSVTSEMTRMIQSNLRCLEAETSLRTIAITSSIANEGKSKVAANLAAAIAQVGQKVLLIDADLRVPQQHQFWKLPLKKGLSEVLTEQAKFQVLSWKVMNDLDILTAGSKLANPLSCLDSERMRVLLAEAANLYDFVIIDVPPILVAADALAIAQSVDGVLLVARPGVVDLESANAARDRLNTSNCHVLGTIVNGTIAKYETEDHFAGVGEYFSDEQEPELPWHDYMTQLGHTIADRDRRETGFNQSRTPTHFSKP